MNDRIDDDEVLRNPRVLCPYEEVYRSFRSVAEEATRRFRDYHEIPILVCAANAESAVRSIKTALRYIPKVDRPSFLHWLMSQMLEDILKGTGGVKGNILIAATKERKKKKKGTK